MFPRGEGGNRPKTTTTTTTPQQTQSSKFETFIQSVRNRQKTGQGQVTTTEPTKKTPDVYDFSQQTYKNYTPQQIQEKSRQDTAQNRYESTKLFILRQRYSRLPSQTVFTDEQGNQYNKQQVLESIDRARLQQKNRPGLEYQLGQAVGSPVSSWDPETKVSYNTRTGEYSPVFPYEGAQHYKEYKSIVESRPELPIARAVTSPYLNIDLAMADKKQRERILIQYLHEAKGSPTGGADIWRGTGMVANTPIVQIAGSYGIGKGIGAGLTLASKRIGMKLAAQGALKIGAAGAGAAMTVPAAVDVYSTYKEKGIGAGIGKGITTGLTFGAAGVGFKESYKPFKLPSNIRYGTESTRIQSKTNIKGFEVKAVPVEKTKLTITEIAEYKPSKGTMKNIEFTKNVPEIYSNKPPKLTITKTNLGSKKLFIDFPGKEPQKLRIAELTDIQPGKGKTARITSYESKEYASKFGFKRRIYTLKQHEGVSLEKGKPLGGITRQINETVEIPKGKPLGGITRQINETVEIPVSRTSHELKPVFETNTGIKTIVVPISISSPINIQRPVFETRRQQEQKFVNKPIFAYRSESSLKSASESSSYSLSRLTQVSRQGVSQRQGMKQEMVQLKQPVQRKKQVYKTTPVIPVIWIPKTDLYGRGIREYGYRQPTDLEYKFRKANIKLPFSDIKTPRFKI